jgi:hypothetical protein
MLAPVAVAHTSVAAATGRAINVKETKSGIVEAVTRFTTESLCVMDRLRVVDAPCSGKKRGD